MNVIVSPFYIKHPTLNRKMPDHYSMLGKQMNGAPVHGSTIHMWNDSVCANKPITAGDGEECAILM